MNYPNLDLAPVAPSGLGSGVPLIDLSSDAASVVGLVGDACHDWGFFQILGHGIAADLTEQVMAAARGYFALPIAEKRRHMRSRDNPWAFYDRELTKEQRDRKQIFDIGPNASLDSAASSDPFEGATPWPDEPEDFAPLMQRWSAEMNRLSGQLIA